MKFVVQGHRLVDTQGEFAIWQTSGPDYFVGAIIGYADGRPLYELPISEQPSEGLGTVVLTGGRRVHGFEEGLIGRVHDLLKAAIAALIDLPGLASVPAHPPARRVMAAADIVEHLAYGRTGLPAGELREFARSKG